VFGPWPASRLQRQSDICLPFESTVGTNPASKQVMLLACAAAHRLGAPPTLAQRGSGRWPPTCHQVPRQMRASRHAGFAARCARCEYAFCPGVRVPATQR